MPSLTDLTSRLQYQNRINSSTRDLLSDFRDKSAVDALIGLGQRFGRNNRALIRGLTPGRSW